MFLLRSLLLTGMIAMLGSVVNACNYDDLYMIVEDGIIDLGTGRWWDVPNVCHGTDVSFWYQKRDDTRCNIISSMRFYLNDTPQSCEKNEPFSLFGNIGSDFKVEYLDVGAYTVSYDLYDSNDCSGPVAYYYMPNMLPLTGYFFFNVTTCP
jgi:hypothetical protein